MDTKTKIEQLTALKAQFESTQLRLQRARQLEESASSTNLSTLLESELERAELILAAKDLNTKLQGMAEDLAKMQADAMPLSDNMKGTFGPEHATAFENAVNTALQTGLAAIRAAKDQVNNGILAIEGKISDEDQLPPTDMAGGAANAGDPLADPMADTGDQGALNVGGEAPPAQDPFAGADAASGPAGEPLGRARRESREGGAALSEGRMSLRESGARLLESESLDSLIGWVLREASTQMQPEKFASFAQNVSKRAGTDGEALAGWIGQRKYGAGFAAQFSSPVADTTSTGAVEETPVQQVARSMAEAIESNIARFGRGHAAAVVEAIAGSVINEGDEQSVLEAFEEMYGTSPAHYSIRKVREATSTGTTGTGGAPAKPVNPAEKKKTDSAVAKMAAGMAGDKNMANKPASAALNGLQGQDRATAQKAMNDMKAKGQDPKKVGDLVAAMSSDLDENAGVGPGHPTGKPQREPSKANKNKPHQTSNQSTKPLKPSARAKGVLASGTVSENINAAQWPTDENGQYKGEPFQTDYNKLGKAKDSKATSSPDGGALKPEHKGEDLNTEGPGPKEATGDAAPPKSSGGSKPKANTSEEPKSAPAAKSEGSKAPPFAKKSEGGEAEPTKKAPPFGKKPDEKKAD